jgi:hypothetical protein
LLPVLPEGSGRSRKKLKEAARLLARGHLQIESPSEQQADDAVAEAAAAFGLYCEDESVVDDDEFWLWPENEEAFWLWCAIQTQWQKDMERRVGLNYAGVESCMRMRGIKKKDRPQFFALMQAMEYAALEVWSEKT